MNNNSHTLNDQTIGDTGRLTSRSIDWYAEGESRVVEVNGVQNTVRFISRKGRRGRIAIDAPAGASFQSGQESRS